MEELFLIEPSIEYKDEFIKIVKDYENNGEKEYYDMYKMSLHDFEKYVNFLENNSKGLELPKGWVAYYTYWLTDKKRVLGVIRIRKELNSEFLKTIGGHIGYDIPPSYRKNGYGKCILKLGIDKVRLLNIPHILIVCNSKNYASINIIERNGGVFNSEIIDKKNNICFRRYCIKVTS